MGVRRDGRRKISAFYVRVISISTDVYDPWKIWILLQKITLSRKR